MASACEPIAKRRAITLICTVDDLAQQNASVICAAEVAHAHQSDRGQHRADYVDRAVELELLSSSFVR
jgi:hypothetical protein